MNLWDGTLCSVAEVSHSICP